MVHFPERSQDAILQQASTSLLIVRRYEPERLPQTVAEPHRAPLNVDFAPSHRLEPRG